MGPTWTQFGTKWLTLDPARPIWDQWHMRAQRAHIGPYRPNRPRFPMGLYGSVWPTTGGAPQGPPQGSRKAHMGPFGPMGPHRAPPYGAPWGHIRLSRRILSKHNIY